MPVTKNRKDFETNLAELEKMVKKLEEGSISLSESLKTFESGVKLAENCRKILIEAQQKINILTNNCADEEPQTEPFSIKDIQVSKK